jgi:hypothetical protein
MVVKCGMPLLLCLDGQRFYSVCIRDGDVVPFCATGAADDAGSGAGAATWPV